MKTQFFCIESSAHDLVVRDRIRMEEYAELHGALFQNRSILLFQNVNQSLA